MFIIQLNHIEGVELVLKALDERGCIDSGDLAAGIRRTLIHRDEKGVLSYPQGFGPDPEESEQLYAIHWQRADGRGFIYSSTDQLSKSDATARVVELNVAQPNRRHWAKPI